MDLEVKFAEALKANNASLNESMAQLEDALAKGVKMEEIETIKSEIKANETKGAEIVAKMQEQLDHVAGELKKSKTMVAKKEMALDPIKAVIKANSEAISQTEKGAPFKTEIKGMTIAANLSGDAPRDYSDDVVIRPGQKVNVEDLARVIPITGGTYTYYRSALTTGAVATQTEGNAKAELVYTYTAVDASTDFIAGVANYSKKMRNNLAWLEATLSMDLRRDYYKAENSAFQAILAAQATASSSVITGSTLAGMLVDDMAALEGANFEPNAIVVTPADWYTILKTPKDDLQAVVTFEGSVLRVNGVPCVKATWLPANKYYVGDWSRVTKPVTEGFSFETSEEASDNFIKNNITAKVEAQTVLTVEQPDAILYGDFTSA